MTNNFMKAWIAGLLIGSVGLGTAEAQNRTKLSPSTTKSGFVAKDATHRVKAGALSAATKKSEVLFFDDAVGVKSARNTQKEVFTSIASRFGTSPSNNAPLACIDLATPYSNGFESAADLTDATIINVNNDANTWVRFTNAALARTGTTSLAYTYNSANAANDWFITNCMTLQAGKSYNLSFFYRTSDPLYPERLKVAFGNAPTVAGMTTTLVDLPNVTNSTAYQEATVDITVATTGTYYIGFQAYSLADQFRLYLDDVTVREVLSNDAAVTGVVAPAPSCGLSATTNIAVNVKNNGSSALASIPVALSVNGTVTAGTASNVAAGATTTVNFSVDLSAAGNYSFKAYSQLVGDGNFANDTAKAVTANIAPQNLTNPYTMGFESAAELVGSTTVNVNNDANTWVRLTNATLARTGTTSLTYTYNATNAANDWFITKCLNLEAGKSYNLSFFYRISDPTPLYQPEKLLVALGNAPTVAAMTTTLVDLPNINNAAGYQEATATITVATSGTYYIGFKAYSDADKFRLYVDDVTVNEMFATDAGVIDFTVPESKCGLGSTEVQVWVKNFGTSALANVPVNLSVNGTILSADIASLAPGAIDSLVLLADLSSEGEYSLLAFTQVANDGNTSNDTLGTATVTHITPISIANSAYTNSFEAASDLFGATVIDANNDGVSWNTTAVLPRTGTTCLAYTYNTDTTTAANDWVMSSCITLEAGKNYKASFWYRSSDPTPRYQPEKLLLALGDAPTVAAMTVTLVNLPNINNSTAYQQADAVFTVPATGSYYLGFKAYSDENKFRLYVDDIEVKELSGLDVGAVAVTSPIKQEFGCYGAAQTVAVSVKNYGLEATNVPVSLSVSGAATQTFTGVIPTIAAGATEVITFATTLDMVVAGDYYFTAQTTLADDGDASNNASKADTFTVKPVTATPHVQNFDGIAQKALPAGWVSGKSGKEEFLVVTTPSMGFNGTASVYLNLYQNANSAVTYAEVTTPRFSGIVATNYFSFDHKMTNWSDDYTGSGSYSMANGDSLNIEYSVNCGATFVRLASINASNQVASPFYQKMRFPLTALAGQNNVIFRLVGKYGGAGDYIHSIENFEIKNAPAKDVAVLGLTASNIKYSITPLAQVPTAGYPLSTFVTNTGAEAASLVKVKVNVTPSAYSDSASFATLAAGAGNTVNFTNAFVPTQAANYVANVNVTSADTDADLTNNSASTNIIISDSTMARDVNATPVGGLSIGVGTANGIFQKFELRPNNPDTLTSVTFWIDSLDAPTTVKAMIFRANSAGTLGNNVNALDSTAAYTIPVSGANQFHTITFRKTVAAGQVGTILNGTTAATSRYFVGLREKNGSMNVGYNIAAATYVTNDVLIRFNNAWADAAGTGGFGIGLHLYVRPNFGKSNLVVGLSSKINNSLNVVAFPNPTDGIINLAYDRNEVAPVSIKVINLMGAVVAEVNEASQLSGDRVSINLANQAAGTYIVQITTEKNVVTRKVVLTK